MNILGKLKNIYGNFQSKDEVLKFVVLGVTFFLIIAIYWSLRPLKDTLFNATVGFGKWQPIAKLISMITVFPIVMAYSKLIDIFKKEQVFYILVAFYTVTALLFAWGFTHPTIGLANPVIGGHRWLGWLWYLWVESFGSMIVALFWAYTTDITNPQSARRGFPLIALLGQFGNFMGPLTLDRMTRGLFNNNYSYTLIVTAVLIFLIGIMIALFNKIVPSSERQVYRPAGESHTEPGFLEGLKLVIKTPYLLSIFLIITIFEIIVTTFDYLFKANVTELYPTEAGAWLFSYAYTTGLVAFLCVLFGTNNIQRKLGMKVSLMVTPLLVAGAVVLSVVYGNVYLFFWIMVFSKAVNYALNQPTLKQLYIPTSEDAKYKSQAGIEMFGSRSSKGTASAFNTLRASFAKWFGSSGNIAFMMMFASLSLGLIACWIPVAIYAARKYNKAVDTDSVVC